MLHRAAFAQRHSRALAQRTFFGFGKADAPPPVSLEGKVCWVVGGVDVVGQHVVRGLLDAGASVIVNTRSTTRLEALVEGLGRPERLTPIKGSLLPGRAEATVDRVMEMSGNRLDHVVAHAGVRYWAGRGACDETRTLAGDHLFSLSDEEFAQKAVQVPALHFSAARLLMPRVANDADASYTFVLGDAVDGARSALGGINSRACAGLACACRHELKGVACKINQLNLSVPGAFADAAAEDAFLRDLGAATAGVAARASGDQALVEDVAGAAGIARVKAAYPAAAGLLDAGDADEALRA